MRGPDYDWARDDESLSWLLVLFLLMYATW